MKVENLTLLPDSTCHISVERYGWTLIKTKLYTFELIRNHDATKDAIAPK